MVLGGGTFADRAEVDQAHDLQRAARNAEWNVPEGRIGGVIRQLRARGAEAQRRAWWLLVFLIIVIFAGLGFYLGLPFFQQFADGRKQTLDIQIDDITLRITEQDNLRDTLRDEVAAFLEGKPDLLRAQTGEILNPPVLIGDTVFVTGWDGTILTLAPDGTGLTERRAQTGWDLNPPVRIGDTVFVTGSRGTILTLAPDGSGLTERRVQTGEQLNPPVLIGDTVFVTGSRGTILRFPGTMAQRARDLDLPRGPGDFEDDVTLPSPGATGDATLRAFLTTVLPGVAGFAEVPAFVERLSEIEVSRKGLESVLDSLRDQRGVFDQFPYSYLERERARVSFETYLTRCRGGVATTDDTFAELTKTCMESWRAERTQDNSNWWQTLAQQVPPGILLLFLLATLAALYRYNMRLSGFHHSRADALELYADGLIAKGDVEGLTKLALALASDAVAFGKVNVGFGAGNISLERQAGKGD